MKKKKVLLSILTIFCVLLVCGVSYAISPDVQAKILAEENLASYLKMIEPDYKNFHYTTQDQVMKSYLGDPIKNYVINIENFDENKNILEQAKPYAFYVFPVMAEGNIITDLTVVLTNGEWKVVDIGGHLSKIIYDNSKKIKINPNDNQIIRCAGKTFVVVNKEGKEIGYSPYFNDPSTGLEKETLTSSEMLKKTFIHQKEILLDLENRSSEPEVRGSTHQEYDLSFKQNKSIFERVTKYANHLLRRRT